MSRHKLDIVWVCRYAIWYELEIKYCDSHNIQQNSHPLFSAHRTIM